MARKLKPGTIALLAAAAVSFELACQKDTAPPQEPPRLSSITPGRAQAGQEIILRGRRFAPDPRGNRVVIGSRQGRVVRASSEELAVEVPALDVAPGAEQRAAVHVAVAGQDSNMLPLDIVSGAYEAEEALADESAGQEEASESKEQVADADTPPARARAATRRREPPAPKPEASGVRRASPAERAAALVLRGDEAVTGPDPSSAVDLYRQALAVDPKNAKARAGLERAEAATSALKRSFVASKTTVEGRAGKNKGPAGFQTDNVQIQHAPEATAHIEFEVVPPRVRPGVEPTVRIFLNNYGKKRVRVSTVSVTTVVDGKNATQTPSLLAKDFKPGERNLLAEVKEPWKSGVRSWRLAVQVTTNKGDRLRNRLNWK